MNRVKTFDATGVAPNGKLFAGDLNSIQDAVAALSDFSQVHDVGTLRIGETGLTLSRAGAGVAQIAGRLDVAGLLRGVGGVYIGEFTTAQRNAIAAGSRPRGAIIFNTDSLSVEVNKGSDASPNWQAIVGANSIGTTEIVDNAITNAKMADNAIGNAEMADNAIGAAEIIDGSITAAEISSTLKPSGSAAAGTEALRALGTTAATAAAGNDSRLSDTRTPTDGTVTDAKITAGGLSPSKITGTAVITSDSRLSDVRQPKGIPIGTTLPASPSNGDIATLVDSLTSPTYAWTFQYVAGISDAYKWVLIGGEDALVELAALSNTTNAAYVDPVNGSPTFTTPRAGIYDIGYGSQIEGQDSGAAISSLNIGGSISDNDSVRGDGFWNHGRFFRKVLAASTLLKIQHKNIATSGNIQQMWIKVKPLRVA